MQSSITCKLRPRNCSEGAVSIFATSTIDANHVKRILGKSSSRMSESSKTGSAPRRKNLNSEKDREQFYHGRFRVENGGWKSRGLITLFSIFLQTDLRHSERLPRGRRHATRTRRDNCSCEHRGQQAPREEPRAQSA